MARTFDNITPLCMACYKNSIEQLRFLLEAGASAHHSIDAGSPLEGALQNDNPELIALLVKYGALPDLWLSHGSTPLVTAIQADHKEAFRYFLDISDIGQRCVDGTSALEASILANRLDWTEMLLGKGANPNYVSNVGDQNCVPLILAIDVGNSEIVETLRRGRADPDLGTSDRYAPLMVASLREWKFDIARLLIEHDCKVNIRQSDGQSPLRYASWNGDHRLVSLLLDNGADASWEEGFDAIGALHGAAYSGHCKVVKMLLASKYPPDVNHAPPSWKAPLFYAAQCGYSSICQDLLLSGANPNYVHDVGYTPLLEATKINNIQIVKLLLDHGASPSGSQRSLWTPFHQAAFRAFEKSWNYLSAKNLMHSWSFQLGSWGHLSIKHVRMGDTISLPDFVKRGLDQMRSRSPTT